MRYSSQPDFNKSVEKYIARELHITLYPLLTGNLWLPDTKQYWFLSALQERIKTSEVYQITKLRKFNKKNYQFVRLERCFGVDRSKRIINKNKRYWPEVNWINNEWNSAILSAAGKNNCIFNPGLVYLDTTSFGDKQISVDLLKETLNLCDHNTLVICNVMMNNPRAGVGDKLSDPNIIVDNLLNIDNIDSIKDWNISPQDKNEKVFHSYQYQTNCTVMRSYIFFKGVLPQDSILFNEFDKYKNWCDYTQTTGVLV